MTDVCDDHSGVLVDIPGASPRGHLGTRRGIDACIASLVKALNDAGAGTIASCCGHGHRPGTIILEDGREVHIFPDYETGRRVDRLFDRTSYGERVAKTAEVRRVGTEWPPGVSDGLALRCADCGTSPAVDYSVTDEEWARVVPRSDDAHLGVICLRCFVVRGGRLSQVTSVQVVGNGETLVLDPTDAWQWGDA